MRKDTILLDYFQQRKKESPLNLVDYFVTFLFNQYPIPSIFLLVLYYNFKYWMLLDLSHVN